MLFFPANFFLNKIQQENIPVEKKISEPEVKKIPAEKKSEVRQENFKFPEIKFPEINSESPQKTFEMPKVETEITTDPRLKNFCTLYLNDKIFTSEIPAEVWKNWRREGDKIFFPADWNLTLKVENKNNFALKNFQLEAKMNGAKKIFSATIPATQSKNFLIPLSNLPFLNGVFNFEIRLRTEGENIFA